MNERMLALLDRNLVPLLLGAGFLVLLASRAYSSYVGTFAAPAFVLLGVLMQSREHPRSDWCYIMAAAVLFLPAVLS